MKKIIINGNKLLSGNINISGAKNSAVALIPAAILSDEETIISNVPNISDIDSIEEILSYLGVKYNRKNEEITINPQEMINRPIPETISSKLRASYYFMSALLGKYKHVEMSFPGGCKIGKRPIDQTLKGFKALGATVIEENDNFIIDAKELVGNTVRLDMPSVGATINTMIVAAKAKGKTKIENAAREPEIVNVATFLNSMGAKITGAGTNTIKIEGVEKLHNAYTEVIPDRIEAGTYTIIGALLGNNLKIDNIIPEHISALTDKLRESGANITINEDNIVCNKVEETKKVNISTYYFPGFATDLQQPFMAYLTQCKGTSKVEENIYENRFMQVEYLNKMGAEITTEGKFAFIKGKTNLKGTTVEATDLRAGACLVIAGLISEGTTTIENVEHILRGYDKIIEKLKNVGADIEIEEITK